MVLVVLPFKVVAVVAHLAQAELRVLVVPAVLAVTTAVAVLTAVRQEVALKVLFLFFGVLETLFHNTDCRQG